MSNEMLKGVRVLDFTSNAAGPTCTAMMADYGAYVVKVERPGTGNDERTYGIQVDGVSLLGAWLNRGKKSITLNLKKPESIELIKKIIGSFDILVESGRPGVMDKLGLGYETIHALNPKLVYCSISAFGQTGPYAQKPGYDLIAQAMSGLMDITGEQDGPPVKSGTTLSDYVGGVNAFGNVITALRYAEKTGIGQHVDISLLMSVVFLNGIVEYLNIGQDLHRTGNHHSTIAPYGLFEGNNGQSIVLAVISPKLWTKLCQVIGHPDLADDPEYATLQMRRKNKEKIIALIENWLRSYDDISQAITVLEKAGIPCSKVYDNKDMLADPHMKAEHFFVEVETPKDVSSKETFFCRNCSAKFSEAPGVVKQAPYVGENNHEVLKNFGYTDEEIDTICS